MPSDSALSPNLYVPAPQQLNGVHEIWASELANSPVAQPVHEVVPVALCAVPMLQGWQCDDPLTLFEMLPKRPAAQPVHVVCPTWFWYVPCAHVSQSPVLSRPQPMRFLPAAHVLHAVQDGLPGRSWYLPSAQS